MSSYFVSTNKVPLGHSMPIQTLINFTILEFESCGPVMPIFACHVRSTNELLKFSGCPIRGPFPTTMLVKLSHVHETWYCLFIWWFPMSFNWSWSTSNDNALFISIHVSIRLLSGNAMAKWRWKSKTCNVQNWKKKNPLLYVYRVP